MNRIFLKDREEDRILLGHPWVYDNEIGRTQGDCADGEVAEILTKSGLFLGQAVVNRKSRIVARILTREREETIDAGFFARRIRSAAEARAPFYGPDESYRLAFAESDLIPGLVVDRFAATDGRVYLSVQFLTLGAERFRSEILAALAEVIRPAGIYERSDVHVRGLEGIPEQKGWIVPPASGAGDEAARVVIRENGIELEVDMACGQKTGYFLDQKDNRRLVARLAQGRSVLDTFTHTGAFGLNAWKGGASSVRSVDISEEAVATVERNIERNGADAVMRAETADAFDLLKQLDRDGARFDLVVLDPPAFTKSAKMVEKAYGGYKEINLRAMKILAPGGYLVTCSCSHFFGSDVFYRMLANAAHDARRLVQVVEKRGPGPDHPALLGYPESDYLKCAVLRVL